jgi:hypothetical protein
VNITLYNFTCDSRLSDSFAHTCAATLKSSQLAVSVQDLRIAMHLKEEMFLRTYIFLHFTFADFMLFQIDFCFVFSLLSKYIVYYIL